MIAHRAICCVSLRALKAEEEKAEFDSSTPEFAFAYDRQACNLMQQLNFQPATTDVLEHRKGQLSILPEGTFGSIDSDSAEPGGEVKISKQIYC
eukprot:6188281-Pleurochrysis_carterae.AAC.2